MTFTLWVTSTSALSFDQGTAVAGLLAVCVALLAIIGWFLRREIKKIDTAHEKLNTNTQRLLEGDVPWVQNLNARIENLAGRIDRLYELPREQPNRPPGGETWDTRSVADGGPTLPTH